MQCMLLETMYRINAEVFKCLRKQVPEFDVAHLPYWMFVTGWRCSRKLAEAATGRDLPLRPHNES